MSQEVRSPESARGKLVIALAANVMGRGDEMLGKILIGSFLHTMAEGGRRPDTIVLYNTAVQLLLKGSPVADDLKRLEAAGTEILACGTCIKHFQYADQIIVGRVSNMYEISDRLREAGSVVRI
jgi:selenium metabolism protein YedF